MKLFLAFLSFQVSVLAQDRNEKMRILNSVVAFMDNASYLNQKYYSDVKQLAYALEMSKDGISENYFYSSNRTKQRVLYTDMDKNFKYKELHPDKDGYLSSFESGKIAYLQARERTQNELKKPFLKGEVELAKQIENYILETDSLFEHHLKATDYVVNEVFRVDIDFIEAKRKLKELEKDYYNCHQQSKLVYSLIENYAFTKLPANKLQPTVLNASKELNYIISELDGWEKELFVGDKSKNNMRNENIRNFHDSGAIKDTFYFKNTEGYQDLDNGWYPHSRYYSFYLSLPGNIYHYSKAKINHPEVFLKESDLYYNKFLLSYNQVIDSYNNFIALADGKTWVEESECCPEPKAVQLHENVMLNKARLLYLFTYVEKENEVKSSNSNIKKTQIENSEITVISGTNNNKSHAESIKSAAPHHLIYLLDASTSMNERGVMANLKADAKYLVKLQRTEDLISIVSFSNKSIISLESQSCGEKEKINGTIDNIQAFGSTNVDAGIETASAIARKVKLENGIIKILLFTDGKFQMKKESIALLNLLKIENINFRIVYLGEKLNPKTKKEFEQLSEKTGSIFYDANEIELEDILVKEASE